MFGTDLPRFYLQNYYTTYIRPHLEYASICNDSISDEKSSQIKKIQRRAILAYTRAYQRTSTELIYVLRTISVVFVQCNIFHIFWVKYRKYPT